MGCWTAGEKYFTVEEIDAVFTDKSQRIRHDWRFHIIIIIIAYLCAFFVSPSLSRSLYLLRHSGNLVKFNDLVNGIY